MEKQQYQIWQISLMRNIYIFSNRLKKQQQRLYSKAEDQLQ